MDRDKLFGAHNAVITRQACFRAIDRTQERPEVQVQALALALYAVCDALDIDIKELLVMAERVMHDLDGPFVGTFAALREYAKYEIGRM